MSHPEHGADPSAPSVPPPGPATPPERPGTAAGDTGADAGAAGDTVGADAGAAAGGAARKRRRGSRGGRGRAGRPRPGAEAGQPVDGDDPADARPDSGPGAVAGGASTPGAVAGSAAAPGAAPGAAPAGSGRGSGAAPRRGGRSRAGDGTAPAPAPDAAPVPAPDADAAPGEPTSGRSGRGRRRSGAGAADAGATGRGGAQEPDLPDLPREGKVRTADVADRALVRRPAEAAPARTGGGGAARPAGDEAPARGGRALGRYLMCVHVKPDLIQIAILEGRTLIEYYVSRTSDDVGQIHGNVYLGKVQNVLPGMEAAFVDIGTPKNAVLYRGDVQYDAEDIVEQGALRIEQLLKPKQQILCQVTKNPIGAKGARLTQEVSLPGRFVVLIPNSKTYGISKRLPDDERKRLRALLDRVKPAQHGVIVRTAAEGVDTEELERDVLRLLRQWEEIEAAAKKGGAPKLLYREPGMAVRVIREEFNKDYRGVMIDDPALFADVRGYVEQISPHLADRVQLYDAATEGLPLFERFHVHEQVHKALDRKVWLPSGGSLIIEHTEALTVIDVNTGRNVGTSNLEETVFHNNLEAAEEIARQLRLRDIGGIIVIDFIDMEVKDHRQQVVATFRDALSRDKTRTQVFEISELGLVEMTRKRIGEGLLTAFADQCPACEGRGVVVDHTIIE